MSSQTLQRSDRIANEQAAPGLRRVELWIWDERSPEFERLVCEETEINRAQTCTYDEREVIRWSEALFDDLMDEARNPRRGWVITCEGTRQSATVIGLLTARKSLQAVRAHPKKS